MTATILAGLTGYVIGTIVGVLIGSRGATRAYDRGQADLLEQQATIREALDRTRP